MDIQDQALRRAAGVIMWHLVRGHTFQHAVAEAQAREPALTDQEIGEAAQWAQAGILFSELMENAKDSESPAQLAYIAGLPIFEGE